MFSELDSPLGNGLTFASLSTDGYDSDHNEARRSAPDKSNRGSCSNRVAANYRPVRIGTVCQGPAGVLK
jgi:hypothetical protein